MARLPDRERVPTQRDRRAEAAARPWIGRQEPRHVAGGDSPRRTSFALEEINHTGVPRALVCAGRGHRHPAFAKRDRRAEVCASLRPWRRECVQAHVHGGDDLREPRLSRAPRAIRAARGRSANQRDPPLRRDGRAECSAGVRLWVPDRHAFRSKASTLNRGKPEGPDLRRSHAKVRVPRGADPKAALGQRHRGAERPGFRHWRLDCAHLGCGASLRETSPREERECQAREHARARRARAAPHSRPARRHATRAVLGAREGFPARPRAD